MTTLALVIVASFCVGLFLGYGCGGYDGWHNGRRWERKHSNREAQR